MAGYDPLPSWNNGTNAKGAIIEFVQGITGDGPDYVAPKDRIAVLDNDGTLQPERPACYQFLFGLEMLKSVASEHLQWANDQIYKYLLDDDLLTPLALNREKTREILLGVGAWKSYPDLETEVLNWLEKEYPDSRGDGRTYAQMVYQPMRELIDYLQDNKFKVYIVSENETNFLRAVARKLYNVSPEQVIGTRLKLKINYVDNNAHVSTDSKIERLNDNSIKPVAIYESVGRIPLLAVGNSDADIPMLQWVGSASGKRLVMIIHHTDAEREFAYDTDAIMGKLKNALKQASERNWVIVDMQKDWKDIFAEQE